MNCRRTLPALAAVVILILAAALPGAADEGLWPYNQFPTDTVKEKRKFEVTPAFLDNLRLASARIPGGSAAFVSPEGLLLTNEHLVAACMADPKVSFYAPTRDAERKCPGLDASVLESIEDVTAKVKAAAKENAPAAQALELRNAAIAKIEQECAAKNHGRCSVVTLFSGGRYDLYSYKVYSDLRLVFAPELELAQFGHERDAVTYLRYGLDAAFLRAYENGRPASTPHYLKWSSSGVNPGDLVFAAANPEITSRASTSAELKFLRDTQLPLTITRLQPVLVAIADFSAKSDANRLAAQAALNALLLEYKLAAGRLIGLRDDRLVNRKINFENKIKTAVQTDAKLGVNATKVWDQVATAYRAWAEFEKPYEILEGEPAPGSTLFKIARDLVRGRTLDPSLDNAPPIRAAVETIALSRYLEELKSLGDKEAPLKALLQGKLPQQVAEAAVMGTSLLDPAARKKLASNSQAVKAASDPLIRIALLLEPAAQRLRKKHEDVVGSLEASAEEKIAGYRFRLFGASDYPDATGTPRVEYGVVQGYTDRAGVAMPPIDSFGGLFYRSHDDGPYQVPQKWIDRKASLRLETPLDFVSTCDVGGGDYGSAVVNRAGELVGITFDGNLESIPGTYLYSDEQARAVHVAASGIAQALENVYRATALLSELGLTGSGS